MARYQHQDHFYRRAEKLGLPSRAAFKLEELLTRFKLVGKGGRVIDLGCSPGGWLSILARVVGSSGRIVGIDLVPCSAPGGYPVITLTGDIADPRIRLKLAEGIGGAADLVTSDLAPKLSGIAERDRARSRELLEAAIDLSRTLLKPGGAMIAKVFMGPELGEMRALYAHDFAWIGVVRTRASRRGSSELYIVARGFQAHRV
jgi:23S rRNA (uridine2552-2'-O)-methyltransferase